jgi:hypothetical protein
MRTPIAFIHTKPDVGVKKPEKHRDFGGGM